jgi:ABC-type transporter Mla subunit MlaD
MQEMQRNVMVGVFALLGLVALGTLIVVFGQGPAGLVAGGTYPLHIHFDEVVDIREGNQVMVKGLSIGRVVSVSMLTPTERTPTDSIAVGSVTGVDVVVAIENRYRLPEGSRAQTTEPVLGQGRPPIIIFPGPADAPHLSPNASLPGEMRAAIDQFFPPGVVSTLETSARQIGNAAEALTPVLVEFEDLIKRRTPAEVDEAGLTGNLSTAVARLDASLKHFNDVLGDPTVKSQVREAVANFHDISERGQRVVEEFETTAADFRAFIADGRKFIATLDKSAGNIEGQVRDLTLAMTDSLDRMDTLLDHIIVVAAHTSSGKGTVGQLFMDDKLHASLVFSVEQLSQAIEEFRALVAEWREGKVRVGF